MKSKVKEIICLVGGSFSFLFAIFNYSIYNNSDNGTPYYSGIKVVFLVIGACLSTLSFLFNKWRREKLDEIKNH